jgi:hypothetical protein
MSILNRNELLHLMSTDKYKNRYSYMVKLLYKELRESIVCFGRVFMPHKRCEVLKNMYLMMSLNLPLLVFNSERNLLYIMSLNIPLLEFNSERNLLYIIYISSFQHLDQLDKMIKKGSKYVTNTDFIIMKDSVLDYRKNYEMCRMIEWGVDKWKKHIPVDILNIISSYLF